MFRSFLAVSALVLTQPLTAQVVPIQFSDPNGDGVFDANDGLTAPALRVSPASYGTLGWFNTNGLMCFGNARADYSGAPTIDGLFNINPTGSSSTAMSLPPLSMVDGNTGTTGWGVVGGAGAGTSSSMTPGDHYVGFRTSSGYFGFMHLSYDDGGTPFQAADDRITINSSFVNATPGQGLMTGTGTLATCVSKGTGCGGLQLTCVTRPVQGNDFILQLDGTPNNGFGTVSIKIGPTLPGVLQPAPFAPGCETYLGNGPLINLPVTTVSSHTYWLSLAIQPALAGVQLGLQGAALNFAPFEVTTTEAFDAVVGDV